MVRQNLFLKEKLMSRYTFKNIEKLSREDELQNGFFLWVLHADKKPPHIGCSINGRYFSLKAKGKDFDLDFKRVLSLIKSKKIPTVFIELNSEIQNSLVVEKYTEYICSEADFNTCLSPITAILDCKSEAQQLSELLKLLENRNELGSIFGLNLTDTYQSLPEYSKTDIENRLLLLKNAKVRKNTPAIC